MGIIQEFKEFINEYKVVGLAVAFIMGGAATTLVQALVNDIIMPLISPLISAAGTDWQTSVFSIGPINFALGHFLSAIINFLILALVVFLIAKWVLKEDKVTKK
ncbi:MscL family protein [Candidatus Micrarchaeota archaeon]|nr:MscL family protein [Candidatus Micrarchaeota archaeon]